MITAEVQSAIDRSVLAWLATVSAEGMPNVSPKEVFCAHGADTLLIAHIASPTSVRNIAAHPQVCVSFIDVFVQNGFKVLGRARVVRPTDPDFAELSAPLAAITQERFPIHGVMAVHITAVEPIIAPSYRLFAETTEAAQVASAMAAYGVMPKPNTSDHP